MSTRLDAKSFRARVLAACGTGAALLFLALAGIQLAAPFGTPPAHALSQGASSSTGFMIALAPLLAAWAFSVHLRCSDAAIRTYLEAITALEIAWLLIVLLKYPLESNTAISLLWYLYYVPMLLVPTLCLFSALRAAALDHKRFMRGLKLAIIAADCALIAFVLTNNLHHAVFAFSFADPNWQHDYRYCWGYWLVLAWALAQVAACFACTFPAARKQLRSAFVPLLLVAGVLGGYALLYCLRNIVGTNLALVFCTLVTLALELALDLGILPSYTWRAIAFRALPFNLRVLTSTHDVAFQTQLAQSAKTTDAEVITMLAATHVPRQGTAQFRTSPASHTLYKAYRINGGTALLAQDVTSIDARRDALTRQQESLRKHNELLSHSYAIESVLRRTTQERALYDEIEQALAAKMGRIDQLLANLPHGTAAEDVAERRARLMEVKLLVAYCKRKGGLVLAEKSNPAFDRERLQLVFNETAADLRTLGVDCAALVATKRILPAAAVSVLYDCLYDFAAAAFAASGPVLMLFVDDAPSKNNASEQEKTNCVVMRAALQAGAGPQPPEYARALAELRQALETRRASFSLDVSEHETSFSVRVCAGDAK